VQLLALSSLTRGLLRFSARKTSTLLEEDKGKFQAQWVSRSKSAWPLTGCLVPGDTTRTVTQWLLSQGLELSRF